MLKRLRSEIKHIVSLCLTVQNLGILLLVTIVDSFATGFLSPIFAPFLHDKGINLAEIGYIFSVASLLPFLLQPVMGELSDRIGRKVLIVGTSLVSSILTPLYIFLNNVWAIGILQATNITLERSAAPASSAMLADVAPKEDRATVFASLGSINNLAYVGSLVLGGFLLAGLTIAGQTILPPLSKTAMFWLSAILFIIASVLLALFLKETAPDTARKGQTTRSDKTLFKRFGDYLGLFAGVFRHGRTMQGLFLYRFFFSFSLGVYFVFTPLLARQLGAPDSWLGPIVAISWLTYAIGQPVGGRVSDRSRQRKRYIVFGLSGMVVCNTGIALSPYLAGSQPVTGPGPALVMMLIFWALIGIPDAISRPSSSALVVDIVAPGERGKVFGVLGSGSTLGSIFAPLCYGHLAEQFGLSSAFLLASFSLAATAATVAFLVADPKLVEAESAPAVT
jgi:DHA1 family multidrug resistance protein-like MFS transporter